MPTSPTQNHSQTQHDDHSLAAVLKMSLEELVRTSPSVLAFDPASRAQFFAKIDAMDEAQKEGLRQILIEERQTMIFLDQEEAKAKAKARKRIVDQFEVNVIATVHQFEKEVREKKQNASAPNEPNDQEQAEKLLTSI